MNDIRDRILERIREGRSFLVSSHLRLDGDGIGSALAMHLALKDMGKTSRVVMPGRIPEVYRFLPGAVEAVSFEDLVDSSIIEEADTFIAVDVPDVPRLGGLVEHVCDDAFCIAIDHHPPRNLDVHLTLADPSVAATGEILFDLFVQGNIPITPEIATNLYAAILTDTQGFSLPNTTASCLRAASQLVALGADAGLIGEKIYRSQTIGRIALWSDVARNIRMEMDGRLAWTAITEDLRKRHDVHPDDTQDFSDIPRQIRGVEVGILFRQLEDQSGYRVSFRSNRIPILEVAERFGGGGHKLACGCELKGTLEEVSRKVVDAVADVIGRRIPSPSGGG